MKHPKLTHGGYSIFEETMADMTYPDVEELAHKGAVVLWALGVIEEHGPTCLSEPMCIYRTPP